MLIEHSSDSAFEDTQSPSMEHSSGLKPAHQARRDSSRRDEFYHATYGLIGVTTRKYRSGDDGLTASIWIVRTDGCDVMFVRLFQPDPTGFVRQSTV
jgi:hypothetical protein